MADDLDNWLSSGGAQAPQPQQGDPVDAWLQSGGASEASQEAPPAAQSTPRPWYDKAIDYVPGLASSIRTASGTAASGIAGVRDIWGLLHGQSLADVDQSGQNYIRANTYEPASGTPGALAVKAGESNWNPLNWPGLATAKVGQGVNKMTGSTMAGPITEGILNFGMQAGPLLAGGKAPETEEVPTPSAAQSGDVPMPLSLEQGAPRGPAAELPEEPPARAFEELEEPASTGAPGIEQMRRQRVLNQIGLTPESGLQYRTSAATGDPLEAATDYQLSKLNTEPGRFARGLLDNERSAITNYSQQSAEMTGGRIGNTQTDAIARGESVTDALQQLSDHYDNQIRSLYQAADQRAQGVPTDLSKFQDVLKDDSLMTNQDRVGLRSGLNAYLKKLGTVDDNGNVTASVQQAETIRKYLNDEWSPQNGKLVRSLKDALDDDVTQSAGSDIYGQARALRAQRGRLLDDPKGISQLLDTSGPDGINRAVPSDKVMSKLQTMPPEQLGHILNTLRNMPPGLQDAGQEAISNIQSDFAQSAHDVGNSQQVQWNSKGYNQFLKNNSTRLSQVFADRPDVLRRMYTTNEAGKILRFDPSYPGAATQAINIGKAGTVAPYLHRGISMGAGALGGWITGGPGGALVGGHFGDVLGGKVTRAMQDRAAMKAAQARATGVAP